MYQACPAPSAPTVARRGGRKNSGPVCTLCKQAGRPKFQHYMSKCKYLPDEDKQYMSNRSRVRQTMNLEDETNFDQDDYNDDEDSYQTEDVKPPRVLTSRRISTRQSPYMKVFHKHYPLQVTLDTGAEISMVKHSVAKYIGATLKKTHPTGRRCYPPFYHW